MEPSRKIIMLIYGRAFSFFLSLLIPFFLTRILVKEDYGSYQQLIMIYTIVQAILIFGMPQSLLYYFPRKEAHEHPLLIKQTWTILFFSALTVMAIFWLSSQIIDTHHLKEYLVLLGIYTSLMIFVMPIQNLLTLEGKISTAMWLMVFFTIIDLAVLPTAAWLNPTTFGIIHGIIVAAALKAIMVLFHVYSTYFTREISGNSYIKEQLAYGIPVGLTAMVYVINVNVDKYLVGLFFSSSVFAVYYLGSLWAPIFGWITQSAAQVVTPMMSKAHKDGNLSEIKELYRNSVSKLAFVFLPATILLIFIAEPLILTMFTETYRDSIPIFMIYLILVPTYSLNLSWILMASGQTKYLLKLALSMSIVNVILSYWLLTILEGDNRLLGIPFSTVLVTWISTIMVMNRSLTTIESSFFDTYPVKEMWKIASVSALSVLPVILLSAFELSSPLTLVLSIISFAIMFLALSYKLKLIGENEIKLAKSFLPF